MKDLAQELLNSSLCCNELKEVAQAYLNSIGTENEETEKEKLIERAQIDITTIDHLLEFLDSDMGKEIFGDKLDDMKKHTLKRKEDGKKYCDCPACSVCEKIINLK